jgi:hypothetical protein
MPKFQDYVRANDQLATDLEALIRDFVNTEVPRRTLSVFLRS